MSDNGNGKKDLEMDKLAAGVLKNGFDTTNKSPEKTPEQFKQERLERYQKNPETFLEFQDIIFATIRNPKSALGVSVLICNCKRTEMDIAQVEINHRLNMLRSRMDIEAEMKKQAVEGLIVTQPHKIIDFLRRKR